MKKQKESKKQTWMMAFIAFIMITSVIGFVWQGGTNKVRYNGIPFVEEANGWSTKIKGKNLIFNYLPQEVDYINVSPLLAQRLTNTVEIDTTYDVDDPFAEYIAKVQYTMGIGLGHFEVFVVSGFTSENEFAKPIITCENATVYVPVIYFKKSNQTMISLENNCIIAEAFYGEDLVKVKDRLLYAIFGVIK
jgi:hypothetical protein